MKHILFTFLVLFPFLVLSQNMRYFKFKHKCGYGNWQDTSFIAATKDQEVIDTVLANLSKPFKKRKFINGQIDYGHGGYNKNADHWFKWHFIPGEWQLVDLSVEVCDGCAYSNVDQDTSYWIGKLGQFCPWGARPVSEVNIPTYLKPNIKKTFSLFPNPAKDKITLKTDKNIPFDIKIYNSTGKSLKSYHIEKKKKNINVSNLNPGIYFIQINTAKIRQIMKVSVIK